jgi:hypothetical protein
MYWTSGCGRIELNITKKQAEMCSHSGSCDMDVKFLSGIPKIDKQLAKIPAELLANELREYGAWSETELQDHAQNLQRILWLACNDITEQAVK